MNFQTCSDKFEFSDKYLNLSTVYEMCLHSCMLYCEKPAFLGNFSLVSDIVEQCSLFLCTQELDLAVYDNILATNLKVCLSLSLLSSHSVGSPNPELADTTFFFTLFCEFPSWYFVKDLQAGISALREFVTVGEACFLALRGERVNVNVVCKLAEL